MGKYRVNASVGGHKLGDIIDADASDPLVKSGLLSPVSGAQKAAPAPKAEAKVEPKPEVKDDAKVADKAPSKDDSK